MLNFTAIDLQLYKIFTITRVSFFGTHCSVGNIIKPGTGDTVCEPWELCDIALFTAVGWLGERGGSLRGGWAAAPVMCRPAWLIDEPRGFAPLTCRCLWPIKHKTLVTQIYGSSVQNKYLIKCLQINKKYEANRFLKMFPDTVYERFAPSLDISPQDVLPPLVSCNFRMYYSISWQSHVWQILGGSSSISQWRLEWRHWCDK